MSPAVMIVVGAVVGSLLLTLGILYERRRQDEVKKPVRKKKKLATSEQPRSPVYEIQLRDHRRSLLWTSVLTIVLVGVALLEWSTFGFRGEWTSTYAHATNLQRGMSLERGAREYYVDVWYSFTINNVRYQGNGRLNYPQESRRDQVYNTLGAGGDDLRVWYHPIMPGINFPWRTGPSFAVVMLILGTMTGFGMISSGLQLMSTKAKGGPKQRPEWAIKRGEDVK